MARLVGFIIWIHSAFRMHSQHREKNRSPGFAVGGMQLQTIQELQELLFAVQKFEGHIGPLRFLRSPIFSVQTGARCEDVYMETHESGREARRARVESQSCGLWEPADNDDRLQSVSGCPWPLLTP